jgi:hypothetical protein
MFARQTPLSNAWRDSLVSSMRAEALGIEQMR